MAITTGGASGISEAMARKFSAHDVQAIIIADVEDEKDQNAIMSISSNKKSKN